MARNGWPAADPVLAKAAQDLIAKIVETIPERLQPLALDPCQPDPPKWDATPDSIDMTQLRAHIYASKKVLLHYRDEQGRDSKRTVWPIAVGYLEAVRMLAAWCELRKDFRSFRIDRMTDAVFLDEKYPERRAALRTKWMKTFSLKTTCASADDMTATDSPCQSCGACCSYSSTGRALRWEDDAALDLIPEKFVNDRLSGMRCDGDRCSALTGKVGTATACGIYDVRPEVCRTCMPGDPECPHGAAAVRIAGTCGRFGWRRIVGN